MAAAQTTTPQPAASRRSLLAGVGLAAVAGAARAAVTTAADPDAELIRLCQAYIDAISEMNTTRGLSDDDIDARWVEIDAISDGIDALPAQGLTGLCALARVVVHLAQKPDGSFDFGSSHTGDWAEVVVCELLRLHGEG